MSNISVENYIGRLRQKLPYVPPVPVDSIKALHRQRDFGAIIRLIRQTMNVGVGLTVHWTNGPSPKGLEQAKAWINLPEKMPYYGTPEFKQMKMDIFILKSFRDNSNYEEFAITVAHELSHVVLESLHHPLRDEEKAVDLTAMLLGFSLLYRRAAHAIKRVGYKRYREERLGYLSPSELNEACEILVPAKLMRHFKVANFARQYPATIALPAVALAIWAGVTAKAEWDRHRIVAAERDRLERRLPIRLNDKLSMTDVRAGWASLTRVFELTFPPDDQASFQAAVRWNLCAAEKSNIEKGISYISEYRAAYGTFHMRVEVASCP